MESIELSTRRAADVIPLSEKGLEMHQASHQMIQFVNKQPPSAHVCVSPGRAGLLLPSPGM